MKRKVLTLTLVAAALLEVSCAANSQPALGTAPGDMSSSEHQSEAKEHEQTAERHEDLAAGSAKAPQAMDHKRDAAEHSQIADQHEEAADKAAK